jgi:uncharacterized membrane protein
MEHGGTLQITFHSFIWLILFDFHLGGKYSFTYTKKTKQNKNPQEVCKIVRMRFAGSTFLAILLCLPFIPFFGFITLRYILPY